MGLPWAAERRGVEKKLHLLKDKKRGITLPSLHDFAARERNQKKKE